VTAAMRTPLVAVMPYDKVEDAARLMLKHKIGGPPIVADARWSASSPRPICWGRFCRVVAATNQIMNP